jgi:hypothetical protein
MLKPWTFEKICGMLKAHRPKTHGGMTMLHLHNSTRIAVLGAAVVVLLIGAGCKPGTSNDAALSSTVPDRGPDTAVDARNTTTTSGTAEFDAASEASSESSDVSELTWTTYASPALGLSIPYPEGWQAQVGDNDDSVDFVDAPPPPFSDKPSEMWIVRERGTPTSVLDGLEILSSDVVVKNGRRMTRIIFIEDFYEKNPNVVLYLWEQDGWVYQLGGPNVNTIEYAIDRLEVLP